MNTCLLNRKLRQWSESQQLKPGVYHPLFALMSCVGECGMEGVTGKRRKICEHTPMPHVSLLDPGPWLTMSKIELMSSLDICEISEYPLRD